MEHVRSRKMWLAVLAQLYVSAKYESVASENPFCLRVPYDQLLVWVFHGVELVDVYSKSASSA